MQKRYCTGRDGTSRCAEMEMSVKFEGLIVNVLPACLMGRFTLGRTLGWEAWGMAPESPETQAEALVLVLPEQWAWDSVQSVLHLARQLSGEILELGTQVRTHRRLHRSPQMRYGNNWPWVKREKRKEYQKNSRTRGFSDWEGLRVPHSPIFYSSSAFQMSFFLFQWNAFSHSCHAQILRAMVFTPSSFLVLLYYQKH